MPPRAANRTLKLWALQHPVVRLHYEQCGGYPLRAADRASPDRRPGGPRPARGSAVSARPARCYAPSIRFSHLPPTYKTKVIAVVQASLRRLRAIESGRPWKIPIPIDAQAAGARLRGEPGLEGSWFGPTTRPKPVLRNLQLHSRPGKLVALVGRREPARSTLFSLLLRSNTAPAVGSSAARTAGTGAGPARPRFCAVCHRPGAPAELRVLRNGGRGDPLRTSKPAAMQRAPGSTGWPMPTDFMSKPCGLATAARMRSGAAIFSASFNCKDWRCPGRARQPRPCCAR